MSDFIIKNGVLTEYTGTDKIIVIPEDVTSIDRYAFDEADYDSIESITIPDSLNEIDIGIFDYWKSLEEFIVSSGNDAYTSDNGVLYNKDKTKVLRYPVGKKEDTYNIPANVTKIGERAFCNCDYLNTIKIPDSVNKMGEYAFCSCKALKEFVFPDRIRIIPRSLLFDCKSIETIEIPNGITRIGESAFSGCFSLKNISIPDSVTRIEERAFNRCSNLETIIIPNSVNFIGEEIFGNCGKLRTISLPSCDFEIESFDLHYCEFLENINIDSENLIYTSVDGIIYNKKKTELLLYPAGRKDKSFTIPDGVSKIGENAFQQCEYLEEVIIPEGVTHIDTLAFKDCKTLKKVSIAKTVISIRACAFGGCKNLETVELSEGLATVQSGAFAMSGITDITLPYSTTTIGRNLFFGCSKLRSVKICSDSINNAPDELFFGCNNLKTVELPECIKHPIDTTGIEKIAQSYSLNSRNEVTGSSITKTEIETRITAYGINLGDVPTDGKKYYLAGFFESYDNYPKEIKNEYISYIKKTYKELEPKLLKNPAMLRCFVDNMLIKKERIDALIEEAQKNDNPEILTMLIEYQKKEFGAGFDKYLERQEAVIKEEQKKKKAEEDNQKMLDEIEELLKDPSAPPEIAWDIQYDKKQKTCKLMSYQGCAENVVIPEKINGFTVVEIQQRVYDYDSYNKIKSIVVPDTVTVIGNHAFDGCYNMETIQLGKNVRRIGREAFSSCSSLKEIVLPPKVNTVTKWMFRDCSSLEKIVFECIGNIFYDHDCNFLRDAGRPTIYIKKSAKLDRDFDYLKKHIVVMD